MLCRDQYTQSPVDHWVVGIVSLLLTCGGAIVVPALIIFPGHIWRACGWAEAATKYEVVESADGGLATLPVMVGLLASCPLGHVSAPVAEGLCQSMVHMVDAVS